MALKRAEWFLLHDTSIKRGIFVSKYQKRTIYIVIIALVFFLILSLVTHQWGFFLWSLIPLFMVCSAAFTSNHYKKTNDE